MLFGVLDGGRGWLDYRTRCAETSRHSLQFGDGGSVTAFVGILLERLTGFS